MSKPMNPLAGDDSIRVHVVTRDKDEVCLLAWLQPEFDDEGFLRILGQKKCLVIHRSNVSHFSWEPIEPEKTMAPI